ncbi:MAG TPA: hypothetical protein VKE69_13375 [Planctomycetota bacterium]|nr:hypothetical protein [Planctomycetota bacterium]
MTSAAASTILVAIAAWLAGRWVVPAREPGELRVGHAGLETLAGLCLLAAALSCASALGAPRAAVTALAYAIAAGGLLARRRAPATPDGARRSLAWEAAALAPVVLLGAPSALAAVSGPPLDHDAVAIWLPKVHEAAEVDPPEVRAIRAAWPHHMHPQYPRGLAWLATAASPIGDPDPRLVRLIPLLFALALSLATVNAAARSAGPACGVLSAAIVLATAEFSRSMHLGQADAAMAGAVLLAAIAATHLRDARGGLALAAVAGAGAGSIKAEGLVVTLAVGVFVLARLALRRDSWRTSVAALAILGLALPWWIFRSHDPTPGLLYAVPTFLADPSMLVERLVATPKTLLGLLVPPGSQSAGHPSPTAWISAACLLVLLPGRTWGAVVWPALVLLLADYAIYVVTPAALHWHVATSATRLLVQALPTLVLGATTRLAAATRSTT